MLDIYEQYEKIYDKNSKKYFKEVLSSYNNENYRSAIVMLYSVVIYDILSKLKELDEIYNQPWARRILENVNTKRQSNPTSSDWEKELIISVGKQHDFLNDSVIEEIEHLKQIRNQCAHPALDLNDELFTPTRYTADELISRMLNELLTIPAMFTGKITDYITEQIAKMVGETRFEWGQKEDLSRIFQKYFQRMNEKVFTKVFKDIWKLTFFTENEDCNKYRFSNLVFLEIMLNERHTLLINEMKKEKTFFNNVSNKKEIIRYLFILVFRNDYIFSLLDEETKEYMKRAKNESSELQLYGTFLYENEDEYLENFKKNSDLHSDSKKLLKLLKIKFPNIDNKYRNTLISIFLNSSNFDNADRNFETLILPMKHEFTKEEVLYLLKESEIKPQIYGRYTTMNSQNRKKLFVLLSAQQIEKSEILSLTNLNALISKYNEELLNVNEE